MPLADEALVAQEIAKFVGRSDITEEVVRFRGHLEHWQALTRRARAVRPEAGLPAAGDEPRGQHRPARRRRARGVGVIVSLKAELEKMREQVQNVE